MIQHVFFARGHWWFDSGVIGLFLIAKSLTRSRKAGLSDELCWPDVHVNFKQNGIYIDAPDEQIKPFVEACYEDLASRWWNVSTDKQQQDQGWVLYDTEKKQLYCAAKRMPTPIAALSVSATSWRAEGEDFEKMEVSLQKRVNDFLQENKKTLWGARGRLLYQRPVCHSQLDLFPKKGRKRVCSVCGQEAVCSNVSQTSFPLFSSQSATFSFNSNIGSPDILCWECELLGKFAIHTAHYKVAEPYTHVMQLNSGDMRTLLSNHAQFGCQSRLRTLDPQSLYYYNFGKGNAVLQQARLPYEVLFGFYLAAYDLVLENQRDRKNAENQEQEEEGLSLEILTRIAPLQVVLMSLEDNGQTFITKEIINYTDSTYCFKAIDYIYKTVKNTLTPGLDTFWRDFFWDLELIASPQKPYDPVNGLYRNRILQKFFDKSSILLEIERFVFKKSLKVDYPNLSRILLFLKPYELAVHYRDNSDEEGQGMTKEQIEIATKLGAQIVLSAKDLLVEDEKKIESLKAVKGDLFSLRKTRTPVNFLEQLNRLQFRYGIVLNKEIIAGILEEKDVSFDDFKAYCMISALNTFNSAMRPFKKEKNQEKE
ncbi:MAG: hypothetical protein KBH12_03365 [Synergistaceae bacterium]|nr:hypothetical protein [Synergistaceae bacterium]